VSYAIGRQIAEDLRAIQGELDTQALMVGIGDGLKNVKARWTDAELGLAMQRFQQEMQQKQAVARQSQLVKNRQEGAAFLAANKQKEGVQVTASGLQYKVLRQGNGPSPTPADTVRVHYRGTFTDGTEFESSLTGPPAEFPVGNVIDGWTEALQKMRVGDRWQVVVPSQLAYGDNPDPRRGMEPGRTLVFEVELIEIVKQ
jgi:FKBP-type peptidyl-prolyl cis-trans isomerase